MSRWPTITGFKLIGRFGKTHGALGAIRLSSESAIKLTPGEFIFVDLAGSKVPYELLDVRQGKHTIVTLKLIGDTNRAKVLAGREVYGLGSDVAKVEAGSEFSQLDGYTMCDMALGRVGEVIEVQEFPQQIMAIVEGKERRHLIPLNNTFVRAIDPGERLITTDLPEGILDI